MYGEFVPDPTYPSGFRWRRAGEPEPTRIQPAVPAEDDQHADFAPLDPDQLPLFDLVDSTTIVDLGAP